MYGHAQACCKLKDMKMHHSLHYSMRLIFHLTFAKICAPNFEILCLTWLLHNYVYQPQLEFLQSSADSEGPCAIPLPPPFGT